MSVTIFRKMRGRIVPITVDEEHASSYSALEYKKTPKHQVTRSQFDTITSFTVPNATCQNCGKDVFYYENSYGSRVLFDSLGPPWPIHPCYNMEPITKKKDSHIIPPGWEPVFIDRGVMTSNGGLRVQGKIGNVEIRFLFESAIYSKMKIDVCDVPDLIVFASRDRGRVQTHTGKKVFMSRFETVPENLNKNIDGEKKRHAISKETKEGNYSIEVIEYGVVIMEYVIPHDLYNKYFLKNSELTLVTVFSDKGVIDKIRSDSHGMFITLNELSTQVKIPNHGDYSLIENSKNSSHLVGTLIIKNIEVVIGENERMSAIISGALNKKIKVNYILSDDSRINEFFDIFSDSVQSDWMKKCLVKDTEDNITLEVIASDGVSNVTFNVSYVRKDIADKMVRVVSTIKTVENRNPLVLQRKKRTVSIEEHIGKLVNKIHSPMADAFLNAKKK
ncbi:hypothetical protein HRD68_00870 (plasmid) [Yersinia massiliensis]|uniref:hypothetical protein n=1 Tax=Yersinia massiliensis TaxID=419257 RepID=UPI00156249EA|nr:hypothetical protein [Yersinia massiliensis]QKJ09409.1 hypothetical protein HRD68_00870 [Yersinia massiliensis]